MNTGDRLAIVTIFWAGAAMMQAFPISVSALVFGYFASVGILLLRAWWRVRQESRRREAVDRDWDRMRRDYERDRAEQLNGEFFDAADRDTRGRGIVK